VTRESVVRNAAPGIPRTRGLERRIQEPVGSASAGGRKRDSGESSEEQNYLIVC
jgi:hypothetical protein